MKLLSAGHKGLVTLELEFTQFSHFFSFLFSSMDQGCAHSGTQALSAAWTIALPPLRYDLLFILLRYPGLWLAHVGVR